MFLVNRLFGTQATPKPELLTIDGGRLFLVRPESVRGARECLFIDASISIRRTTHEFHYQLVCTRTFQDGEEQLLEDDEENSDERSFLLDSSLFLSLGPTLDPSASAPIPLSFTWLDPDGDGPDDEFEFVLDNEHAEETNELTNELAEEFQRLAWRCMWERREKTPWPQDEDEANRVQDTLEQDFKVERATLAATATPSTKVPLFRTSPTPSLSGDEDKPSDAYGADERDYDPNDEAYEAQEHDDSGDELAAALLSKAVISPKSKQSAASSAAPVAVSAPRQQVASSSKGKEPERIPEAAPKPPTSETPAATSAKPIISVPGQLHLFDKGTGMFMLQEEEVSSSLHEIGGGGGYWLIVEGKTGPWVSQGIEKDMVLNFSEKELAMVFNFRSDQDPPQTFTWLIRFSEQANFDQMQEAVSVALFEGKWGSGAWKKLKEDERDYQKTAYIEDAEMYGIEEENEVEEELDPVQEDDEEEYSGEEQESEDERESFAPKANKAKNSQLAVGYKEDLSFVVQGDMIGVFKQQRDGGKKLKFVTSIVNISTPDGKKGFTPSKVMLHSQDTSMILQNPLAPGALYRLDLETGKVVDEYKVSENFSVTNFIPDSKFAQTTQQQTFIGLSHNGVFRIDPRLNGLKLVDSEFKQYATKNNFSVAATTESGRLAVASEKGDIRLFDKLGKNAKTALPALGDPIIGIDVTADGRWVLATCRTYLLLIDTVIPEGAGKYAGSSGFDRSFPAAQKPHPRRLQLSPEHVAQMQIESQDGVNFTPAKFNAGLNETERTIVTSTGPFVVAWNFRKVKAGDTHHYTLRRFSDTVIADNFKFGGDREIIVTLPGNVFVEDKKKLKAASRDSISKIVKEYY